MGLEGQKARSAKTLLATRGARESDGEKKNSLRSVSGWGESWEGGTREGGTDTGEERKVPYLGGGGEGAQAVSVSKYVHKRCARWGKSCSIMNNDHQEETIKREASEVRTDHQ